MSGEDGLSGGIEQFRRGRHGIRLSRKHSRNRDALSSYGRKDSVQSEWVRTEADEARRRGILVPALLDDIPIPLAFKRIQAASLIGWDGDPAASEFFELASAISAVLSKQETPGTIAAASQANAPRPKTADYFARRRFDSKSMVRNGVLAIGIAGLAWYAVTKQPAPVTANPDPIHEMEAKIGLKALAHGGYTPEEDNRLRNRILNATDIKLLTVNAGNFSQTFKNDLQIFFSKPKSSMKVILATEDSDFYREEIAMTFRGRWKNEDTASKGNQNQVEYSRKRLADAADDERKIKFKYFNTQFRLPVIIIDDKYCYLTIRLSPDESPQALRMEFEGGSDGFVASCVNHFDKLWDLSRLTPEIPKH